MNIGTKMKVARNIVTSKAGRSLLKGQKHSPTLLFAAGVVGFGATVVMASKATLRLEEIVSENESKQNQAHDMHELGRLDKVDYTTKEYKKDVAVLKVRFAKDIAKLYAPTIAVGVLSVGALTGSHVVLNRRYTGVVAAYSALEKGFEEYRTRVTDLVGEEKERELRFDSETRELAEDTEKGVEVRNATTVKVDGASQYARFFSKDTSQSWSPQSDYNLVFLQGVQNWCNDLLKMRGHVFLNDVFDSLGMERTKAGAVTGWVYNRKDGKGDNYIDFGIFDHRDRFHDFITGREGAILLDFNVDGLVWELI